MVKCNRKVGKQQKKRCDFKSKIQKLEKQSEEKHLEVLGGNIKYHLQLQMHVISNQRRLEGVKVVHVSKKSLYQVRHM